MKEFVKKHKALMIALLAFVVLIIAYSITASKWKKEDAVKNLENLDGNGNEDGTLYDINGNVSTDGTGMTWDALVQSQIAVAQASQPNPMYDTSMGGGDNSQQGGGDSGGGSSGGGGDSSAPAQSPVTNPMQQSAVTPPPAPTSTPLVIGGNQVPSPPATLTGLGGLGLHPTIGGAIAVNNIPFFHGTPTVNNSSTNQAQTNQAQRVAQRGSQRSSRRRH